MSGLMATASVVAGLNILLLLVLTGIWLRNYRTFRTALVLGLSIFGLVLLLENALALYYFITMDMLYATESPVQGLFMGLRLLQFVALMALTWATIK